MKKPIEHYKQEKTAATRSKHELLYRYLKIWAGMVLNSRKPSDLIYLDTCAGTGLFPSSDDSFLDKAGSPIIGLNILSDVSKDPRFKTRNKKFFALLFEKDEEVYKKLVENLDESSFPKEMYKLENVDYLIKLDEIVEFIKYSFVLAFFDPFNIAPLPFYALEKILTAGKTDSLIFFPAMQIQRYQGYPKGKDFPGKDKMIENLNIFFSSSEWIEKIQDIDNGNKALEILTSYYMKKIGQLGKHSAQFNFLYEEQDKILFKIILATKSTEAVLQVKELIRIIDVYQNYLREQNKLKKTGQIILFNQEKGIFEEDVKKVASELYDKFKGEIVLGDKIYEWTAFDAGEAVYKPTVRRAITRLKKEGKIYNPKGSNWGSWDKIRFI